MSRNGLFQQSAESGFFAPACFAVSVSLISFACVFLGIFMSFWAMCFSFLSSSIGYTAKRKPLSKNTSFFVHYFGIGKTLFCSVYDRVLLHTVLFSKINGQVFNAFNNQTNGASPVSLLLASGRPFAIFRRISFVVVNSVYRVSVWALSHISNKILKSSAIFAPSIANKNTSSSIIGVCFARGLVASGNHTFPDRIKRVLVFKRHALL